MKIYLKLGILPFILVLFAGIVFLKSFAMGRQEERNANSTEVSEVKENRKAKKMFKDNAKAKEIMEPDSLEEKEIEKKMIEDDMKYYRDKIPQLIEGLKSKDWEERARCAYALGKSRDIRAVKPLMEIILKDKRAYVRVNAVIGIGYIEEYNKDTTAVPSLISALQDTIEDVRFHAALALAVLGDTIYCVQALEKFAWGKNKEYWTIDWDGYIGKSVKGKELEKVQRQMRRNMQKRAIEVLGSLGTQQARIILKKIAFHMEDNEMKEIIEYAIRKKRGKISPAILH
jgi:hypothetical protein